jgi:TM2 domain-containing membrane protein YozV
MEEQGLALSGCTTTECFVQVGQLAGASKVIVGKVSKVGETYTVTVRVVDVFLGNVELSESAESNSLDGLLSASREMAGRLAASIPVVGTVVSVSGDTVKLNLGTQEGVKKGDTVELYRLGEEYYDPDTGRFLGRDIEELGEAKITRVLADELSEALYSGDIPPIKGDKVRLAGSIEVGEPEVVTTAATVQPRGNGPEHYSWAAGLFGNFVPGLGYFLIGEPVLGLVEIGLMGGVIALVSEPAIGWPIIGAAYLGGLIHAPILAGWKNEHQSVSLDLSPGLGVASNGECYPTLNLALRF